MKSAPYKTYIKCIENDSWKNRKTLFCKLTWLFEKNCQRKYVDRHSVLKDVLSSLNVTLNYKYLN